jgi:hypothetical protein
MTQLKNGDKIKVGNTIFTFIDKTAVMPSTSVKNSFFRSVFFRNKTSGTAFLTSNHAFKTSCLTEDGYAFRVLPSGPLTKRRRNYLNKKFIPVALMLL